MTSKSQAKSSQSGFKGLKPGGAFKSARRPAHIPGMGKDNGHAHALRTSDSRKGKIDTTIEDKD